MERKRPGGCSGPFYWVMVRSMRGDQAEAFQLQDHLMGAVVHIDILGLDAQLGVGGHVIGIGNPGEFLDLAFACQFVQALAVAAFAFLDRGGDVHFDEGTELRYRRSW